MKKSIAILIILTAIFGCNKERIFPDREYLKADGSGTGKYYGVYFGDQFPLRSLVLGQERFENPDNDSLFHIGVSIGGMYENTKNWTVDYSFDKKLCDSLIMGQTAGVNDIISVLPDNYYTISPVGSVTIPAGSFNGLIEVKLKKEFFADPKSVTKKYVVPLRITRTSADTILSGKAKLGYNYDIRRTGDFNIPPKNFVLFAIKFVNPYHGIYFHRGAVTYTGAAAPIVYRNKYLELNGFRTLLTSKQFGVTLDGIANNKGTVYKMNLDFKGQDITISPAVGATYAVTGTGKFYDGNHPNSEEISGIKHPTIYLDYTYKVGTVSYSAKDTLVMRERGISYQTVDASTVIPFNKVPVK